MKEPDQAEIMRSVKRGGAPYKKHPEEQEKVMTGAPENKEVKDDKPEQIVHPIRSKPEQIVHPMQNMHYVKEQIQPPPPPPPQIMATQDAFSHMYMPRMSDKDNNSTPGILKIPMSKINDHTVYGSHHLPTSHPGYLSNTGNARYSAGTTAQQPHRPLPMSMTNLQFPRSQTPVSSNYNSLASLSTPNFNQNTLSSSFGNNQPPFISQGHMTQQEQLLAL